MHEACGAEGEIRFSANCYLSESFIFGEIADHG
jgi:hypothetical protein